jgi:hypothetical protein
MGDQSYAEATGTASARHPQQQRLFPNIAIPRGGSAGSMGMGLGPSSNKASRSVSPAPAPYEAGGDAFLETKTEFIYPVAFPDAPIDTRVCDLSFS